ncbi:MAG TPA: pseudouridine synthase [Arenicellales bacterium]|nr:pseudouridine synthase [Arenicellales bacterium]
MTEKIHKVLARAGLGSRRRVEQWIEQGRVTINGEVARIGARVDSGDKLAVDGRPVEPAAPKTPRILVYHKPLGELVTRDDPQGRPTVFRSLPDPGPGRWIAVGRLDINSTGLLLFTDDGELANRLMHPRANLDREYLVRVYGAVDGETIERLKAGIELDGRPARFKSVVPVGRKPGPNQSFRVVLSEGRNREVRRLWEAVGCSVSRLKRIRYGPVKLPRDLEPGQWRYMPAAQVRRLTGAKSGA